MGGFVATLGIGLACSVVSLLAEQPLYDDLVVLNHHAGGRLHNILLKDFWGLPLSSPLSTKTYRPLTTLTFWLQSTLHGTENVFWYHAVNVVLHLMVVLAFRSTLRAL